MPGANTAWELAERGGGKGGGEGPPGSARPCRGLTEADNVQAALTAFIKTTPVLEMARGAMGMRVMGHL